MNGPCSVCRSTVVTRSGTSYRPHHFQTHCIFDCKYTATDSAVLCWTKMFLLTADWQMSELVSAARSHTRQNSRTHCRNIPSTGLETRNLILLLPLTQTTQMKVHDTWVKQTLGISGQHWLSWSWREQNLPEFYEIRADFKRTWLPEMEFSTTFRYSRLVQQVVFLLHPKVKEFSANTSSNNRQKQKHLHLSRQDGWMSVRMSETSDQLDSTTRRLPQSLVDG